MGWRTVVVTNTAKLDYKMDYLVVREGDRVSRIHLSEISLVILETPAISLTAYLLCELAKNKIDIIFCDEKRYPNGRYMPFYGSHDTSNKVRKQCIWDDNIKRLIWKDVVKQKILGQLKVLERFERLDNPDKLSQYISDVQLGDETNREGHAAKVYFNSLFGKGFSRDNKEDPINAQLNYGYGILLSIVCREVIKNGYITQLGIHHDNMFNDFNLACDLMEPFRPFIDLIVLGLNHSEFNTVIKREILGFLSRKIIINDREQYVINAIEIYVKSILDAITNHDSSLINFPEYEFKTYESNCIL